MEIRWTAKVRDANAKFLAWKTCHANPVPYDYRIGGRTRGSRVKVERNDSAAGYDKKDRH